MVYTSSVTDVLLTRLFVLPFVFKKTLDETGIRIPCGGLKLSDEVSSTSKDSFTLFFEKFMSANQKNSGVESCRHIRQSLNVILRFWENVLAGWAYHVINCVARFMT